MLVGELFFEAIDLLHRHAAIGPGHLPQEGSASLVTGGKEDQIAADDRRGDHGRRLVDRVGPLEFARLGVDREGTGARGLDIDLSAPTLAG